MGARIIHATNALTSLVGILACTTLRYVCGMPHVMPLRDSRARAEKVYYLRAVAGLSWSAIRDQCGYSSVGGAQRAYERHRARNPLPDGNATLGEILERKRLSTGVASKALARAMAAEDWTAVASLLRTITSSDNELARLFGLHAPERQHLAVTVAQSPREAIDQARQLTLESIIDAEVIEQ